MSLVPPLVIVAHCHPQTHQWQWYLPTSNTVPPVVMQPAAPPWLNMLPTIPHTSTSIFLTSLKHSVCRGLVQQYRLYTWSDWGVRIWGNNQVGQSQSYCPKWPYLREHFIPVLYCAVHSPWAPTSSPVYVIHALVLGERVRLIYRLG